MKHFFLLCAVLSTFALSGQGLSAYGVKGGLSISNWNSNYINLGARLAYHLGGFATFPLEGAITLRGELLYSAAGVKSTGGSFDGSVRTAYLSIPVLASYEVADGIHIQGGLQPSILVGAKTVVKDGDSFDDKDEFTTGEIAFLLGGEYDATDDISAGLRLVLGLNDVEIDEDDETKNVIIQLYVAKRLGGEE